MAIPPRNTPVSFVERSRSPESEEMRADMMADLEIEMPGTAVDLERPLPPGIEIEMEDDGSVTVEFDADERDDAAGAEFSANLAEFMTDSDLGVLANDLMAQFDAAKGSRGDWEEEYSKGLELLGFKYEERTQPFRGATGVTHPLLAEAATQFQAQAFNELLPAEGPVRTQVLGDRTREKEAQGRRVKDFMNYYLMNEMEEYTPEFDQLLFHLPLAGSSFKKVYFDESLGRPVSRFVPAENLVVPYDASDLATAPFVAQMARLPWNDVRKMQVSGFYLDVPVQPAAARADDTTEIEDLIKGQSPTNIDYDVTLLEFHVDLDLPGFEDRDDDGEETGIRLPYIVTVVEDSGKVLAIRRNYREDDPMRRKIHYFVHYKFLPGFGFYGLGLIHTIGGLSRTATAALRQLIDAGTLSNLPAGFKIRGLRIRDDESPIQPGEFRDVDSPGGAIRDGLMPLPFKEPSATLMNLLGFVVQAGQRFATITDLKVGDSNEQAAVGTTIALLEQGTRVMSAIHKRLHYAMRQEFKILARVMAETLPPVYPYSIAGADQTVMAADFDDRVDIVPVSDPNIFSQSQRIALAQAQLQMAMQAPDLHDVYEAFYRMYDALGVRDVDRLLKPKDEGQPQPKDPAQENIDALNQVQLMAFEGQNHDAHIMAHLVFGSSSIVAQSIPVAVSLQKHVMEHAKFKAQERAMAEAMQMLGPQMMGPQGAPQLSPDMMAQIDGLVAQYIAEEMQNLKVLSAQIASTGEGEGPDPLVALKQEELGIRRMQAEASIQKDRADLQLERQKLDERAREFNARMRQTEELAREKLRAAAERETMRAQMQLRVAAQRPPALPNRRPV